MFGGKSFFKFVRVNSSKVVIAACGEGKVHRNRSTNQLGMRIRLNFNRSRKGRNGIR